MTPVAHPETEELLATLEARCREVGCEVGWRGPDWARYDGRDHSLRVFPGDHWVDLQFVGADEGTLKGLWFRYDVSDGLEAPADAPPAAHMRLDDPRDLDRSVLALLAAWLGPPPEN